jgi:hypothetical protein
VGELDGLTEVGAAGVGGEVQRDGELVDAKLRHPGCTGAGDLDGLLATRDRVQRVSEGLGGIQRGPGDGGGEQVGLRSVSVETSGAREGDHRGGGVAVVKLPGGHGPSLVEHTFERKGSVGTVVERGGPRRSTPRDP